MYAKWFTATRVQMNQNLVYLLLSAYEAELISRTNW